LAEGDWLIVLQNPTCGECEDFLAAIGATASHARQLSAAALPFVIVEVPQADESGTHVGAKLAPGVLQTSLRKDITWFVQTPVAVRITGGLVTGVSRRTDEVLSWLSTGQ
jgi:hypothetical protein